MKLKKCSQGHEITTKNAVMVFVVECHWQGGIHLTCPYCNSSGVILDKNRKTKYKKGHYKKREVKK